MRFGNGDLLGRTNGHEFNEKADWDRSYGVVPSRHAFSLYLFAHESHEFNEGTGGAGVLQNAPTFTQNFTLKNYTYPSREGVSG